MNHSLVQLAYKDQILQLLQEDDLARNAFYISHLPKTSTECVLKIKDNMRLAGLPFFIAVFETLYQNSLGLDQLLEYEGRDFLKSEMAELKFTLPFSIALTAERLALNLLARCSSISTHTLSFAQKLKNKNVALLDTRKTTPGLRWLEKYGVRMGGGYNHRFGQADVWMIKDNHKAFLGGLEAAWKFFKSMQDFYRPIVVEIHDFKELELAIKLGVTHVMLDNFSKEMVAGAIQLKKPGMTYEISGGVHLNNIDDYAVIGVDAISVGSLTYGASPVDLSLKMKPI